MANDLTGDYDVVTQFSLGAVNRILAAMHRGKRLPHSLSMAVDDLPELRLGTIAVSVVGRYGDAVSDPARVKQVAYASVSAPPKLTEEVIRNVDPVVNGRLPPPGPQALPVADLQFNVGDNANLGDIFRVPTVEYSYLSGVAQLQLGPPTMQLERERTDRADIHTPAMIRYVPDVQTRPLSAFMRGDIVTTFGVKPVASPTGTNIVVDVVGTGGSVHFNPAWSSNSLDTDDKAAINKALSKSLTNSFQPSSTPLPPGVKTMHFKAFPFEGAVAVMMNVVTSNNPSPNSVVNSFLRGDDHFGLAVNGDAITVPFSNAVNAAIDPNRHQRTDTKVVIDYWIGTKTFHIYTNIDVQQAVVELIDNPVLDTLESWIGVPGKGAILLTIPVQVTFGWESKPTVIPDPVNFNFTIVQAFTLTLNGRHVGIQRLGDVAVNIDSSVPDNEKDPARTQATNLFNSAWNSQQAAIQTQIDNALNADGLQSFLKSLMNPKAVATGVTPVKKAAAGAPGAASSGPEEVDPDLEYTNFEIRPSGIILHGSLSVPRWPAADVEFDKDPWAAASRPEYRALNSWIPGGAIQQYQWSFSPGPTMTDTDRFITIAAPSITAASNRVCLTFTGTRITASGPVVYESVSSPRTCKWTSIPISRLKNGADLSVANRPRAVVPKPTPDPGVEVVAHASPWAAEGTSGGTANFVVHFPDNHSAGQLEILTRALAASGRADAATAILCVLTHEQLAIARSVDGLMYADDAAAWEHLLQIRSRPATVVLNPSGEAVWRHEGEIGGGALAEALRAHLSPGGQFAPQFIESPLRIGQPSPNFMFETEPGERATLRMLEGRPLALLFWRGDSTPAMATLRNLHRAFSQSEGDKPLIVAIDDGEDGEFARGLAAGEEGAVVVVPDPARQISGAYGISMWPTTVFLDVDGLVQDIRFGLISEQDLETSVASSPAQGSQQSKES